VSDAMRGHCLPVRSQDGRERNAGTDETCLDLTAQILDPPRSNHTGQIGKDKHIASNIILRVGQR